MDRRTIFFVISLSLALLVVNVFFERNNQGVLKEQQEQFLQKKIAKRDQLRAEIANNVVKLEEFSLVELYADAQGQQQVATGVLSGEAILTLSTQSPSLETIFYQGTSFRRLYSGSEPGSPIVYGKTANSHLVIGNLPFMGSYDLQMISPIEGSKGTTATMTLAKYRDGLFSIPLLQLLTLNKELEEKETAETEPRLGDAIIMLKTGDRFLPVGIYQARINQFTALEQLADFPKELAPSELFSGELKGKEQWFVLENQTQQLVFSNKGGALVEINLPFESEKNRASIVKEIQFDRDMSAQHPYNAVFPGHAYHTPGENPQGPFVQHPKGQLGGYHPLIRRGLIRAGEKKSINLLPEFYAMNIVSEYPEMAELMYKVTYFDANKIVFEATQRNRKIVKTFTLNADGKDAPYCFDLSIKIDGENKGLWLTSGVPEVEMISNAPAPVMKYRLSRNGKPEVNTIELPSNSTQVSNITPDWICNSNGFLGLIIDPLVSIEPGYRAQYVSGTMVPSSLVEIDEEHQRFKAQDLPGYMLLLPLKGGQMDFRVYAGPFAGNTLKQVDAIYSNPETGYNPDYIASQSFHGWFSFISAPFAKLLLVLMNFFHAITGSWALSIVLLTVVLRLMLYPLNAWSTKSMLKMQQIAPEVQKIQERHKKDPQKAQLEIMNLYRDSGVNPLSGCLPLLIQMPFLIGMFDLLKSTFELRGASFIPGWIDNLAAPDVLFRWSTPFWLVGNELHLLPFLLGAVMFLQQRLSSTAPKDTSQMSEQQRQQRMMGTMMTVVFTVMFYNFPSGLNLYWLSSMLLGILQQWWTQKSLKNSPLVLKSGTGVEKNKK